MAAVLWLLIAARTWQTRSTRINPINSVNPANLAATRVTRVTREFLYLFVPFAVSCGCWLAWFWWLWGTPSPTAPYGASHQMSFESLKAGFPGVFADQEYGVVRQRTRAGAGCDWLVATVETRPRRAVARRLHGAAAAVAGGDHRRLRAVVGRQRASWSGTRRRAPAAWCTDRLALERHRCTTGAAGADRNTDSRRHRHHRNVRARTKRVAHRQWARRRRPNFSNISNRAASWSPRCRHSSRSDRRSWCRWRVRDLDRDRGRVWWLCVVSTGEARKRQAPGGRDRSGRLRRRCDACAGRRRRCGRCRRFRSKRASRRRR